MVVSGDVVVNGNGNGDGHGRSDSGSQNGWTVVDQVRPLDRI